MITYFPQLKDGHILHQIALLITQGISQQEIYETTYIQNLKTIQKNRTKSTREPATGSGSSNMLPFNSKITKIQDHLDFMNSDFAKFKEITARLNICMKQRLGQTAFDQQLHVNEVLHPMMQSVRASARSNASNLHNGITSEPGRFHLIYEILQCMLILIEYDNSRENHDYRMKLNQLLNYSAQFGQPLVKFYKSSRFYSTTYETPNGPRFPKKQDSSIKQHSQIGEESPPKSVSSDELQENELESTMKRLMMSFP